jgi:hypothetical protein
MGFYSSIKFPSGGDALFCAGPNTLIRTRISIVTLPFVDSALNCDKLKFELKTTLYLIALMIKMNCI